MEVFKYYLCIRYYFVVIRIKLVMWKSILVLGRYVLKYLEQEGYDLYN